MQGRNPIGEYNEQQGGDPRQGQLPLATQGGLQAMVSMSNSTSAGPESVSIPIRVDDGQRNCVVYLNFPPMSIMEIHQLIGQMKTIGLNVADRKNWDDNPQGGFNRNYQQQSGYQQQGGGYSQSPYNRGGYNQNYGQSQGGFNNRGGYGR